MAAVETLASTRWEHLFTGEDCHEDPERTGWGIAGQLLSNLVILLPIMYCIYMLAILRIVRDLRLLAEEKLPGMLRVVVSDDGGASKGAGSVEVPTEVLRLAMQRYPQLPRKTLQVLLSWNQRDPSPLLIWSATFLAIATVVSIIYHGCQAADVCKLGNFVTVHTLDHISANYIVSILIMNFMERFNLGWIITSGSIYLFCVILLEFAFPCSYIVSIFTILVGVLFFVLNIIVVREGRLDSFARYRWFDIVVSFALCGFGILLYMSGDYSVAHPLWHALSGIGILAAQTGSNADLPFSPTFLQFIFVSPLLIWDGILLPGYQFWPRTYIGTAAAA